eukprot:624870-Heterocapsa_arctica.AAC.1
MDMLLLSGDVLRKKPSAREAEELVKIDSLTVVADRMREQRDRRSDEPEIPEEPERPERPGAQA